MIDKHIIEPTGTGVILNHRRSRYTGVWSTIRYTVDEVRKYIPIWRAQHSANDWFISEMEVALELEEAAQP